VSSVTDLPPRLERERRTIAAMIEIFCRRHHAPGGGGARAECAECAELLAYATRRLEKCPFHEEKPPCTKCPIHCYQKDRRAQIKAVMRYSGPRMLLAHPIFAIRHWLDAYRPVPELPRKASRAE